MNLARLTVPRPVATSMAFLCVVILGFVSFGRLPVDLMPDLSFPRLSISTSYEGAGPEEIEQLVTRPIERAVASIDGVETIESESGEEQSQVRVSFTWGTDLDVAAEDVRTAIDRIRDRLPDEATTPRVFKFDFSAFPVMFLGVSSDLDPSALAQFLEDRVKYRIERVPGVAAADVNGERKREVQVRLDLDRVQALSLTPEHILAAIAAENVNVPAGAVREGTREFLVRAAGEFRTLQEIADTVVAVRAGRAVKVSDVGTVQAAQEEKRSVVRINGKPGVMLMIRKQSGANTVDVAQAVTRELGVLNEEYPQIQIATVMDSSRFIKQAIDGVQMAAVVGSILATVILFLFLDDLASVVIVAVAIPLSIIATFVLIYFSGFTLNVMTFGGLALGVGLLVDNSIVVLENIFRRLELGERLRTAAIEGAAEVSDAISASTLTTVAVFLPLIFFTGLAGVLFRQLAAVVSFSLICSLVAAAALVPALCGVLYRRRRAGFGGRAFHRVLQHEYELALRYSLGHPWTVSLVFAALLGASVAVIPRLGFELMPPMDEGVVRISVEAQVGIHIDAMQGILERVERICRTTVPEIDSIFVRGGGQSYRVQGGNEGDVRLTLVAQDKRKRTSEAVASALRKALAGIPGVVLRIRADSGTLATRVMRRGSGEKLSIEIRGHEMVEGARLAGRVSAAVRSVDGVTDVRSTREDGRPEVVARIDRARAASHGLTLRRVADALNTLVAGSTASQFRESGDEYAIMVRLDEAYRDFIEKLGAYSVVAPSGERVPLRSLFVFERRRGPVSIERLDQQRLVTVDANFEGRDLASVAEDVRRVLGTVPVPKGFEVHLGGEVEEQRKAYAELALGLVLSLVLVYMVMAAQFESFSAPFVVMFTMPMAVVGVVAALVLTDTPISINAVMGLIMLAGIVVNDAIVLVDAAIKLREERPGDPIDDILVEAGVRRLRPVLMTTATTILGLVPLALALGEGSEIQAPMARVVIGGLTSATFITLVVVPLVYRAVERVTTAVFGVTTPEEER